MLLASAGLSGAGPALAQADVSARIAEARVARPEAFARLRGIVDAARLAPLERRSLRSLAAQMRAQGLYPMLALLQPGAPELAALRAEHPRRAAVLEGLLLDAVGRLRDPAASDTLRAAVSRAEPEVAEAAARGVGRLCLDDDLAFLEANGSPAATSGLGFCRRPATGAALQRRLVAAPEGPALVAAAQAAGNWGSSWAWEALGPEAGSASLGERRAVAQALVARLATAPAEARTEIVRALLLLDLPETPELAAPLDESAPEAAALLRARWNARR